MKRKAGSTLQSSGPKYQKSDGTFTGLGSQDGKGGRLAPNGLHEPSNLEFDDHDDEYFPNHSIANYSEQSASEEEMDDGTELCNNFIQSETRLKTFIRELETFRSSLEKAASRPTSPFPNMFEDSNSVFDHQPNLNANHFESTPNENLSSLYNLASNLCKESLFFENYLKELHLNQLKFQEKSFAAQSHLLNFHRQKLKEQNKVLEEINSQSTAFFQKMNVFLKQSSEKEIQTNTDFASLDAGSLKKSMNSTRINDDSKERRIIKKRIDPLSDIKKSPRHDNPRQSQEGARQEAAYRPEEKKRPEPPTPFERKPRPNNGTGVPSSPPLGFHDHYDNHHGSLHDFDDHLDEDHLLYFLSGKS